MEIKVLGTGCSRCNKLEKEVINALAELDIAAEVTKVEDIAEIMKYSIMALPALVVNEKVVVKGRVPSGIELKKILISNNQ